jgi:hypothetical protein
MPDHRAIAPLRPGTFVLILAATLALTLAACGAGAGASTAASLPATPSGSAMPDESMVPSQSMPHESMAPSQSMPHESMVPGESMMPGESPGASPAALTTVAMGSFHAVDGQATGTAALLHLADGSFEVSFEDFSTPSKAHTSVLLVTNADVMKTSQVDRNTSLDLGALKGTTGMQEYPVPTAVSAQAMGYHAVVLWDTEMGQAVAAASLK